MLTKTPVGLDEIIHTFGSLDDAKFEANHIALFDLPYPLLFEGKTVTHARCHKLLVENFQKAFQDIKAAGFESQVKNFSGIFAQRPIRGFPSHPSTHSTTASGRACRKPGFWACTQKVPPRRANPRPEA